MTNRECIEGLSDEQFAALVFDSELCDHCVGSDMDCKGCADCLDGHTKWLQSEHEEKEET